MIFKVLSSSSQLPSHAKDKVYLIKDTWDDWFCFETQFYMYYFNTEGEKISCGNVKIGEYGLIGQDKKYNENILISPQPGYRTPVLPEEFQSLSEKYFSLGQEDNYYEILGAAPETQEILKKLRDCAFDPQIFTANQSESVMRDSLLRDVSQHQLENRFHRLAHGNATLTKFKFSYEYPPSSCCKPPILEFTVTPNTLPPSNVHAIIGRNGVGKTFLMKNIAASILHNNNDEKRGKIIFEKNSFSSLIFVSFSIFDNIDIDDKLKSPLKFHRIGYIPPKDMNDFNFDSNNFSTDFSHEFIESIKKCNNGLRKQRWEKAISVLSSDPMFLESNVIELVQNKIPDFSSYAQKKFKRLSSGHAILLLIITKLVELLEERTIVIIDEPEGHLHPPLLSAFIRCLSELLNSRNAVAIIATHSPIVLQEVPKKAAWILRRSGKEVAVSHPRCETFGENIGQLTNEVFGLEITNSGCNKILSEKVNSSNNSYEEILSEFNGELGEEAKAILRSLIAIRDGICSDEKN